MPIKDNTAMSKSHARVRSVAMVGLFTAILAVCSQVAIPLPSGVPITLQTAAVALCGYMLGSWRSASAALAYIVIGAVGVPVFSSFGAGVGVLVGRTGGFIFGFVPMVICCGLLKYKPDETKLRAVMRLVLGLVGLILLHILGTLQFALLTKTGFFAAALVVSVPFLIKDVVSVVIAYAVSMRLAKLVKI